MSLFQGFNKRYQDELKEIIGTIDNVITNGNIEDFVEYKKLVGKKKCIYVCTRTTPRITNPDGASE